MISEVMLDSRVGTLTLPPMVRMPCLQRQELP